MERGRVRLLLREAISSAKAGNNEWARDCLTRVIRIDPLNENAWLWLSAVLETPSEKRFCLEKVLSINPENTQARQGLQWLDRQAQIEAGVAPPSQTICPMCGEPNPPTAFECANCSQDLFVRCPQCTERVDIDRTTCPHCNLEIGESSDGATFFFHLGELYLEHGDPKRALKTWDKTLLLNPEYPRVAEVAAEAFFASGQRDLAIQSMERAIAEATDPEQERQLRLRLADMQRELNRLEEASKIYQEMLAEDEELDDRRPDVYTALGHLYRADDDPDAARHHYEMALALDDTLHQVRFTLAEVLLEEGYEIQALRQLRQLQQVEGPISERATARIHKVRPPIPDEFRNRWQETMRGVGRYSLAGLLLLLLAVGRWLGTISMENLAGLVSFAAAGYFLTAATATPRNLPTFEQLAELREGPIATRLRRQGKSATQSSAFQRFLAWQRRSTRSFVANLRLTQAKLKRWLRRTGANLSQQWQRLKASRAAQTLRTLPQSRFFRALAALGQKPFFQTVARFFHRIAGRLLRRPAGPRAGPSIVERIGNAIREGVQGALQRVSQIEITEMQIYRWLAALLGSLLLVLGGGLILFF